MKNSQWKYSCHTSLTGGHSVVCAAILNGCHNTTMCATTLTSPFPSLSRIQQEVPSKVVLEQEMVWMKEHLSTLGSPVVLCHNDLLCKNIIHNSKEGKCLSLSLSLNLSFSSHGCDSILQPEWSAALLTSLPTLPQWIIDSWITRSEACYTNCLHQHTTIFWC